MIYNLKNKLDRERFKTRVNNLYDKQSNRVELIERKPKRR